MRKSTVLAILLVANFVTSMMGLPLTGEGGKFSVSNIAPVLFVGVAAVWLLGRRQALERGIVWFLLVFNATCILSFLVFLGRFEWQPNFFVLAFQDLEIIFCALLWWYGSENFATFTAAVKSGIFLSVPVLALYAVLDFRSGMPWATFGMDDKSHSSVLMCCEAFILIRFFRGKLAGLVGTGLYVASFLTVSRLPALFFPAIFIALLRRSRYAAAVTAVATCAIVYVFATASETVGDVFRVYNRLSSIERVTQAASTTAHVLLVKSAAQMKFADPWVFLFGIGPGNFSKALTSLPVASTAEIDAVDPAFLAYAREGRAPLHSMTLQLLLDYNVGLFLLLVFFVLQGLRWLVRRRMWTEVVFFSCALLASSFYSIHNKPYSFLVLTVIALLVRNEGQLLAPEAVVAPDAPALRTTSS